MTERRPLPFPAAVAWALLAVALALKVALLLTSQSMADGDEAVTGLMAMRVLDAGEHPIYPWGVTYGAGAGVEAHLAAGLFAVFGPSDVALKAAGLLVWLATLALVFLAGRRFAGPGGGAAAALLYGFAPPAAEWSLKVSGGHGVAVLLSLAAIWLAERDGRRWPAAAILPFAAFAHPIAVPLAAALALALLARAAGRDPWWALAALAAATGVAALLLWPPGPGVLDPSARGFDPAGLLRAAPTVALTLFSPNLHARRLPELLPLVVSCLWLAALALGAWKAARGRWLLYLLAPLAVLLAVRPEEAAARHLLLLVPLACLVMGRGLLGGVRFGKEILLLLLASGALVQVVQTTSPVVHGASPQDAGFVRSNVRDVLAELDRLGIRHVYCSDPMFQWNLTWGSRERIVARWFDPQDRRPDYPARVDAARRAGQPVGLVREVPAETEGAPQIFRATSLGPSPELEGVFPPSSPPRHR